MQATHIPGLLFAACASAVLGHATPLPAARSLEKSPFEQAPPAQEEKSAPEFGPALSVDGVPITELDVKRLLIYGKGRPALEWRRVNALIDDEVARRVAQGADPARFEISEEAFQRMHEHKATDFQERFPTLALDIEIARSYSSIPWYQRELRMELRFDAVFIPDDPDEWPEVTFEALRAEAGDILITDFRESYERRANFWANELAAWEAKVAAGEDAGAEPQMPPEDSMYRGILRQIVRDALFETVATQTAIDGLPPHLIASMDFDHDGKPEHVWTTAELWDDVKSILSERDVRDAKLFLAKIAATRLRMEREGFLLAPEEVDEALQVAAESFQSSPFNLQGVVVGSHQFPSLESYASYFGLLESWKRKVEPGLLSPAEGGLAPDLRNHLERANRIMGLGQVNAEVLLVSAFDFAQNRWIEGGWEKARERAEWIKSEYQGNEKRFAELRQKRTEAAARGEQVAADETARPPSDFWSLLLDDHCDYWDPPPPATGRPGSNVGFKMKGRFGDRYRNDLETMVGESHYHHFLSGFSITDKAFFDQEIGTVIGPFEGPMGYYLTRVMKRTPPSRPLNVQNEKHAELLRDDYIRYSLIGYAQESLEQAKVSGL